MCNCYLILVLLVIIFNEPVMSSWDFAVTTKGQINFYASDWKLVTSAAHQFDELSAITFDEIDETLYFNDQAHNSGTIFSLKLASDENHHVEKIVKKIGHELVQGIAFDPIERILYWTDAKNGIIYQSSLDNPGEPTVLVKLNRTSIPHGIAIDVCRRKLYWTNANHRSPSIERASLNGADHEVLIRSDLFMPSGIVVDQFTKRIYWVDDLDGHHYSVECANLDGSNRTTIVRKLNIEPFNLAVDSQNVYWTDLQQDGIWQIAKDASDLDEPIKVKNFTEGPKGIVIRNNFLSTQAKNPQCKSVIDLITHVILTPSPTNASATSTQSSETSTQEPQMHCLNNGYVNPKTNLCICPNEYQGQHCEIPICYNYCIQGSCHISSTGYPQCICRPGYSGDRCENDLCNGYCLNGGRCEIENNEPNCRCGTSYYGRHCELMDHDEMCTRYCFNDGVEIDGGNLGTLCDNCTKNGTAAHNTATNSFGRHENLCGSSGINKTAIFVSCGVVISLVLVFIIVSTIRHVYKPLRPRIKKTYVVHKNVVPTPLTCRPTTEQCEITIENCCNMNICDTPCFDPKTLQSEANKKEDKKTLLNHSEDLMY